MQEKKKSGGLSNGSPSKDEESRKNK
ncbi:hypothetical protein A2U01_0031019, partial [Trifolium medium]|nr:hypothetical protein [Trifolium medium]